MRFILLISILVVTATVYSSEAGETNPLPNAVATPCSDNISNAWLDIFLAIDVSNVVLARDLDRLGTILSNVFETMNIGNSTKHTTRVGLMNYYSSYTLPYGLNSILNTSQLIQVLSGLSRYHTSYSGGGVVNALTTITNQFNSYKTYRRKAVILFESAYPTSNPLGAAQGLKNIGVSIITIADSGPHSNISDKLATIATPGMNFSLIDSNLSQKIKSSLLTANCFCPDGYYQMRAVNATTNLTTIYADCLYGYGGDTDPDTARQYCDPDILVPVTSPEKLDFITDNVVAHQMPGAKNFTTGAVRIDGYWYWQDYNSTKYSFGSFPSTANAIGGYVGYFNNYYGLNWQFLSGGSGDDNARPFICQTHAYDADNMRELS